MIRPLVLGGTLLSVALALYALGTPAPSEEPSRPSLGVSRSPELASDASRDGWAPSSGSESKRAARQSEPEPEPELSGTNSTPDSEPPEPPESLRWRVAGSQERRATALGSLQELLEEDDGTITSVQARQAVSLLAILRPEMMGSAHDREHYAKLEERIEALEEQLGEGAK